MLNQPARTLSRLVLSPPVAEGHVFDRIAPDRPDPVGGDASILGAPFHVMEQVDGQALPDGPAKP